ncbi:DUF222 domain-containing protein [Sinomonas sp. ASV322]|uniref:HNH endonuclease signature motif containing protein n=1 Tax=Sinomonas sp. ASV322 TaxID=3041920 RepID=UPI0027DCF71C|nr:DUF222 domain-containing protein [Sinomonas sp. ASV322]MDQ4503411.1 DUF222 domain-containing protein [Sinomonas sp. ASV322]
MGEMMGEGPADDGAGSLARGPETAAGREAAPVPELPAPEPHAPGPPEVPQWEAAPAPEEPAPEAPAPDGPGVPGPEGPASEEPGRTALSRAAAEFEARAEFAGRLVDMIRLLEAQESRIHALRAFVVSELHGHFRRGAKDALEAADTVPITASEVAAALNVSARTGRAIVEEALVLADRDLAPVLEALGEGRLDRRRARAVMEHACVLPPGQGARFSAAAVAIACPADPHRAPSPGTFSRRLRRLAEDYHDEPLAARRERAAAFRRVDLEPAQDGMCWITAHLPVEVGSAIDTRLEAIARSLQTPTEPRGIAQLRADAFADLLLDSTAPSNPAPDSATPETNTSATATPGGIGACDALGESPVGRPPSSRPWGGLRGIRAELVVTVPARTLTGESEAPGEILGYGPLDAPAARLLAAEAATWTTMYVDPGTGAPLALGRRRYTPSLAIRRFLGARDRACRFPGCDKPAPATEADHTTEWQHGGSTDTANLALLCREHHRLKTLGHWKVQQLPNHQHQVANHQHKSQPTEAGSPHPAPPQGGILEWTSPIGRRHLTYPEADPSPPF